MSGPMMAPMFLASTAISAMGRMQSGQREAELYDAKTADAITKGRMEAIAYKQQGADVLANMNETLAAIITRAAMGGDATSGSAAVMQTYTTAEGSREFAQSADNATGALGQAYSQAEQYQMAGSAAKSAAAWDAIGIVSSGLFRYGQL
jgi:hypothetical protein